MTLPAIPNASTEDQLAGLHVCLTGHRPSKLAGYDLRDPFYRRLRTSLEQFITGLLDEHPDQVLVLHSGLALGADTVWARVIMTLRAQHPDRIRFVAEVPCRTQSLRWTSHHSRATWTELVETADQVRLYELHYTNTCMKKRNEGMVAPCDIVLAIHDGSPGGTWHTVQHARSLGKDTRVVHPDTFRQD